MYSDYFPKDRQETSFYVLFIIIYSKVDPTLLSIKNVFLISKSL